LHNFAFMKQL